MKSLRSLLVYGVLLAVWSIIVGWQAAEHVRVRQSAREAVVNRAKDISTTLGLVIRSQRRFGGIISRERMESALTELIKPGELNAVALLNTAGEVVAAAGAPIDLQTPTAVQSGVRWEERGVTIANLVDLGTNVTDGVETRSAAIVIPRRDLMGPTNSPPGAPGPPSPEARTSLYATNVAASGPSERPPPGERRRGRPPWGRPSWMSEEEYKSLIQKQGVHSFILVMSTESLRAVSNQDLWLRSIIGLLAGVSAIGFGLAWRNVAKTSELQIRLVRASELNSHLREMNLAAAGLAHETRNPLNIIRGLAQMISKQDDASSEIRRKTRDIIDETDRVTAQLNEFINYSRPREVRRAAVALAPVAGEVVRALSHDMEEKNIQLETFNDPLVIEADEQLLRQALFNLLLNAIQAVAPGGRIEIAVVRAPGASEAALEIRDNGPGVPSDRRAEIFKPYVTTHPKGTGLGLAVVQQIVLAHGWEIECLANEPSGAVFRIKHLKQAG